MGPIRKVKTSRQLEEKLLDEELKTANNRKSLSEAINQNDEEANTYAFNTMKQTVLAEDELSSINVNQLNLTNLVLPISSVTLESKESSNQKRKSNTPECKKVSDHIQSKKLKVDSSDADLWESCCDCERHSTLLSSQSLRRSSRIRVDSYKKAFNLIEIEQSSPVVENFDETGLVCSGQACSHIDIDLEASSPGPQKSINTVNNNNNHNNNNNNKSNQDQYNDSSECLFASALLSRSSENKKTNFQMSMPSPLTDRIAEKDGMCAAAMVGVNVEQNVRAFANESRDSNLPKTQMSLERPSNERSTLMQQGSTNSNTKECNFNLVNSSCLSNKKPKLALALSRESQIKCSSKNSSKKGNACCLI
jgi:hypothetical protein